MISFSAGVRIRQRPDYVYGLDQPDYVGQVDEIEIDKGRKKLTRAPGEFQGYLTISGWHGRSAVARLADGTTVHG